MYKRQTQACRALKSEGVETVLVNSNPATIMTDKAMADRVYIEPLTLPVLKKIIERERPDGVLSTLGGQTGLTLAMQLAEEGFLEAMNVKLLGAKPDTIHRAEDRQAFKESMEEIGQPVIPSVIANDLETAYGFAETKDVYKRQVRLRSVVSRGMRGSTSTPISIISCLAPA